jgi:glutamyl-tRNA synthetase
LGWNDGTDKEIYSLEELVEAFDLTRVHKAGANLIQKKKMVQSPIFNQARTKTWQKAFVTVLESKR